MKSEDIRRVFLSFYEDRGHRILPSSPLIPTAPDLLFTIAGMVQFRQYLLGVEPPPFPRAATVQKCFRTENIEDVGTNAKDCTLFEMLGNFSFGDYFKREACAWAWELVTGPFAIDPDRLWVTVYESDDEAEEIWTKEVGVSARRVLRFPREDNFWQMGVAGPCGPNTEIYVDRGAAYGPDGRPTRFDEEPNPRYQEIYNLVFMQYEQDTPFHVIGDLPQTGVDTGMGLERIAQILQDVPTVWDTDVLAPIVARAEEITGARRDGPDADRRLLQIVADHSRAVAFLIADAVTPSNEGRGYVLRRVLRRAITEARQAGVTRELLPLMCEAVIERFAETYPEIGRARDAIIETARREEQRFVQTLDAGLGILEEAIAKAEAKLPGDVAFKLHDTYGFPLDITRDVAAKAGLEVDEAVYERLMEEQRSRSRRVTEAEKRRAVEAVRLDVAPTTFLGYETTEAEAEVVALVKGIEAVRSAGEGEEVDVVLDRTPFYPEGGGQVGDRGVIEAGDGKAEVTDTQPLGALVLHRAKVTSGELHVGQTVLAVVSKTHRVGAERAHTATHILHHTLRDVIGEHVRQMGSLVEPGRLHFDFSHFTAVGRDVLDEVEETANRRVASDDDVKYRIMRYDDAISAGALAFFEEKYGEDVRVVEIGDYSRELCGGTHVHHTGNVGFVKVLREGSIGSNIRRVEALTGIEGLRWVNARLHSLERAAELVRTPPDELVEGIERLLAAQKDLQRRLEQQERSEINEAVAELLPLARENAKGKLVVARRTEEAKLLRDLAAAVRDKLGTGIVILGTVGDGSANLVAAASKGLADAREILRPAAERIGGGAGGKPDLAMAGGRNPDGLDEALAVAAKEAEGVLA